MTTLLKIIGYILLGAIVLFLGLILLIPGILLFIGMGVKDLVTQ